MSQWRISFDDDSKDLFLVSMGTGNPELAQLDLLLFYSLKIFLSALSLNYLLVLKTDA